VIELKTHGGLQWIVERRFSQFYTLNQVLKQRYEELKLFKFPQKKWFSSFATATGAWGAIVVVALTAITAG